MSSRCGRSLTKPPDWRGKVQSLPDGEAYYFRDWPGLIRHLENMLAAATGAASEDESQADSDIQS